MSITLESVVSGVRVKPPKIVVYGVGGIGKTYFAAGAPNPVFGYTEEGQGLLGVPRFEPRKDDPVLRSYAEVNESLKVLYEGDHNYGTFILDTLDAYEPLLHAHTAEKWAKEGIEEFGFQKGYTYAVDEARKMLDWLDALRRDRNMAIVILCHSHTKRHSPPDSEPYDRYRMRVDHRLADTVHDWADCVMFANYRTHVVKDDEQFGKSKGRGVGTGERVLYTEERPAWQAKNRYGLPPELPLSWKEFQDKIVAPQQEPPTPTPTQTPKKKES